MGGQVAENNKLFRMCLTVLKVKIPRKCNLDCEWHCWMCRRFENVSLCGRDIVLQLIVQSCHLRLLIILEFVSTRGYSLRGYIQNFRSEFITKYTLTTINTRWEAAQRVMAAKFTRLTHKIAIKLQLVAESCTICCSRSRRSVRKLLDIPFYAVLRLSPLSRSTWHCFCHKNESIF
jgi:hypothetical protein